MPIRSVPRAYLITFIFCIEMSAGCRRPAAVVAPIQTPMAVSVPKVREKTPFAQLDGILKLVEQAEAEVKPDGGRVLLRYSGTEPKARLLIEGPQQAVLENWSKQICEAIKRQVGA